MELWSIQPESVFQEILSTGKYRCDITKSQMQNCMEQYGWLVQQMTYRIGPPPEGVGYPVWAWYQWDENRKRPDLRSERWGNGRKGDRFVLMELDIPEQDVLLSDFDSWSIILLHGFLANSEEECLQLEAQYDSLPKEQQRILQRKNWERAFDISPFRSDWTTRGRSVQATFWELRKEQILSVNSFVAASSRPLQGRKSVSK